MLFPMNIFVTVLCIFLHILVIVDGTPIVKFSISEKLCISKDISSCRYICVRKPSSDYEPWKVDMITTRDESCHQLEIPEHVPALVPSRMIYYKIYMKEGTKELKMYYFHSEPKETHSEIGVRSTFQESIFKKSIEQFHIMLRRYMYEKEIIYIKNIVSFLEDISADGVIFGYELSTYNNTSAKNLSVEESSDNHPKDINIMQDYFSHFKINTLFIPAIKSTQPRAYNTWFHLKQDLNMIINSTKEVDVKSYHSFSGYVDITPRLNKGFPQGHKITYLIKFVFIADNMIVFLIPEDVSNTEKVYEPCSNICQKYGWLPRQNEPVICCNPIRIKEISKFAQILHGNGLRYPLMPLNETSDGDINLLWHSTVSTVNNERNFNFCAISFVHYMGENIPLNILVEVRNISFCNSTYQMPTLGRNPTIIGLLVKFIDQSPNAQNQITLKRTFKEALNIFSSPSVGPFWTEINRNWKFFTPRRILGDDYSTCFIKISESITAHDGALGYKYTIPRNTFSRWFSGDYVPTTYDCETTNSYPISVRTVFSEVNIETMFKNFIRNLQPETINKYLEHLRNNKHMTPVSHIARSDLIFRGFEFSYSCTIVPMWSSIFSEYWIHVEDAVHDIVRKTNVDVQIYTLEYTPLMCADANNDKLFYLFQHEENSEEKIIVHRYIIKMVISEVWSIAFLTINDVFLLMNKKETPFINQEDNIINLCVLSCSALGFSKMNMEEVQLNYCCEVNTEFVNTILKGKLELKPEQQHTFRMPENMNRPMKRKRDVPT